MTRIYLPNQKDQNDKFSTFWSFPPESQNSGREPCLWHLWRETCGFSQWLAVTYILLSLLKNNKPNYRFIHSNSLIYLSNTGNTVTDFVIYFIIIMKMPIALQSPTSPENRRQYPCQLWQCQWQRQLWNANTQSPNKKMLSPNPKQVSGISYIGFFVCGIQTRNQNHGCFIISHKYFILEFPGKPSQW